MLPFEKRRKEGEGRGGEGEGREGRKGVGAKEGEVRRVINRSWRALDRMLTYSCSCPRTKVTCMCSYAKVPLCPQRTPQGW